MSLGRWDLREKLKSLTVRTIIKRVEILRNEKKKIIFEICFYSTIIDSLVGKTTERV